MSIEINDEITRWTAKRKSALVMGVIQGKQTVAAASRAFDLPLSEIEEWIDLICSCTFIHSKSSPVDVSPEKRTLPSTEPITAAMVSSPSMRMRL